VFSHRLAQRVILGETQRERWDALLGLSLGKRSLGERSLGDRSLGWDALPGDGLSGHEPRGDGQPGDRELLRFARSRALIQSAVAEFIGESGPDLVLDARCPSCDGPHGPLTLAVREGGETGAEREKVVAPSPSPSPSLPPGRRMLEFGSPSSAPSVPSVSLSTSEDIIVVAVSDDARLGVDVEVLFSARCGSGSEDVVQRVSDVASVLGMAVGDERDVLQRWVRVEAVLKADGRGLRLDPRDVSFSEDDADDHDRNRDQDNDELDPAASAPRWRATVRGDADVVYRGTDLDLAPGVVGAVARVAVFG
jgi:hypothetical protein